MIVILFRAIQKYVRSEGRVDLTIALFKNCMANFVHAGYIYLAHFYTLFVLQIVSFFISVYLLRSYFFDTSYIVNTKKKNIQVRQNIGFTQLLLEIPPIG